MDDGVRGRPGPTYRAAANLGMRARVLESRRGLRRRSRAGGCAGEKGLTRGPGASVEEGARERATRWGELRRPRALAGEPERVRGEQAVRDAGLGRVARWRAGERAGRESQLGHGERSGVASWAGRVGLDLASLG